MPLKVTLARRPPPPTLLQAIARDGIYPVLSPLQKGSLKGDEPRRALIVTYLLAQTGLLIGGIDAVGAHPDHFLSPHPHPSPSPRPRPQLTPNPSVQRPIVAPHLRSLPS